MGSRQWLYSSFRCGHGLTAAGATGTALNTKLGTFDYAYDVKGNIVGISESGNVTPAGPRNRSFTLDLIDRLTRVGDSGGVPSVPANDNEVESFTLDEEGNRLASNTPSGSSAFHVTDPANRVTESENHIFAYDANGNLIRRTVKATGETWRYGYTVFDELRTASRDAAADDASPALFTKTFSYDAFGRLVKADREGVTTNTTQRVFHHDGDHIVLAWNRVGSLQGSDHTYYTHSVVTDELVAITLWENRQTDPVLAMATILFHVSRRHGLPVS